MRWLVIGDIHGCFDELQSLLDKAGLAEGDRIIALGDVVDRGPASPRVLDFFRQGDHALSVMGNHERKHVRWLRGEVRPALSQRITRRQIGEADYPAACAFMQQLPLYVELPDALLIHGCWEPGVPLEQQRDTVIVGTLSGEFYLQRRYPRPWYELYDGPKPLIVGHHDYQGRGEPMVVNDRVLAIDTGCCHGKRLTGLLLPEFRFIQVRARSNYWDQIRQQHQDLP